jgi:hypothetical protein
MSTDYSWRSDIAYTEQKIKLVLSTVKRTVSESSLPLCSLKVPWFSPLLLGHVNYSVKFDTSTFYSEYTAPGQKTTFCDSFTELILKRIMRACGTRLTPDKAFARITITSRAQTCTKRLLVSAQLDGKPRGLDPPSREAHMTKHATLVFMW